jgi:hypothetical protein
MTAPHFRLQSAAPHEGLARPDRSLRYTNNASPQVRTRRRLRYARAEGLRADHQDTHVRARCADRLQLLPPLATPAL